MNAAVARAIFVASLPGLMSTLIDRTLQRATP